MPLLMQRFEYFSYKASEKKPIAKFLSQKHILYFPQTILRQEKQFTLDLAPVRNSHARFTQSDNRKKTTTARLHFLRP